MERTKLSGREYSAMQTLFATVSMLPTIIGILEARAADAGAEISADLHRADDLLQHAMDSLLLTVDKRKLDQIMKDLANVRIYVKVEAPGIRTIPDRQFSYIETQTLNDLLNYLINRECIMCDKSGTQARKCPHRQLLESALPHDVGPAREDGFCKYSDLVLGFEEVGPCP